MKSTTLLKMAAITGLAFSSISTTYAIEKEAVKAVYNAKKDSILTVKGNMKIKVSMNGKVVQSQDAPIASNGVAIGKNLVLVAYATIKPKIKVPERPGLTIDTSLEEIKFINASGEEFDAKIVLHDEDLGLAFLALDPKGENATESSAPVIDISKNVELEHLDEIISITRFGSQLRYATAIKTSKVSAVIKKPRKLYLATGASPGSSFFNEKGEFIGITIVKVGPTAKQPTPVILPAKYAFKLVEQAKAKAAELSK